MHQSEKVLTNTTLSIPSHETWVSHKPVNAEPHNEELMRVPAAARDHKTTGCRLTKASHPPQREAAATDARLRLNTN